MMALIRPEAAVIGPGRVGRAISNFYTHPAALFSRNSQLPTDLIDVPIWVCTTNDGLDGVLQHSISSPRQLKQLVFVQNGMLLPWLRAHRLEHNTQVLLYMSASDDGKVTDGRRTCVCGPWAHHVASVLEANGVSCVVVEDWQTFNGLMLVKLLWSSIFWMLSAGLGGMPVGEVAQKHESDVAELVAEMLPLGQAYLASLDQSQQKWLQQGAPAATAANQQQQLSNLSKDADRSSERINLQQEQQQEQQQQQPRQQQQPAQQSVGQGEADVAGVAHGSILPQLDQAGVMQQLLSYSLAIAAAVPSVDMARREFAWRNGFFLGLPDGVAPRHAEWLEKAGCNDLLLGVNKECV